MMKLPRLFIFDMDGTMYDTEPISCLCWQEVCEKYGFSLDKNQFIQMLGKDNNRVRSLFLQWFGEDFCYDTVVSEKVACQLNYYKNHEVPIKEGLVDCLEFARRHDILCAVASSSPKSLIDYLLVKQKLASYYTVVQSGEEVAHGKPDPDIFLTVCQKAGIDPQDALVLEDSQSGIEAAHAANIPAVWIPDMVEVPAETASLVWKRCRTLADVPRKLERYTK